MSRRNVACHVLLLALGLAMPAEGADRLTIRLVSPRAGLLFTDAEPVDVRVRASGGKAPVRISYVVEESAGPWRAKGEVALEKGAGERRLPLKLPGRGLYRLRLTGLSQEQMAAAETWVAVVFPPAKPDPASPWGIFYTPHVWFSKPNSTGPEDAALSHRLLGASWSRLNFWAHSFEKVTVADGKVTAEYPLWKQFAKALRAEGISILGEIAQCPRALSSRPDETAVVGDAGPVWCRVKPRDYALWGQLIENLARDFRDEIEVWEVWNEPNLRNRYWTGTVRDFAVHVEQTARALRRGNPKARVAAAGFVHDVSFADRLFQLGMGKHIDILSVHYTDERPDNIVQWQNLLKKHRLALPIWNSEERSEVPIRNIAGGIERSFKFIHVAIGYQHFRPLVRKDLTVLPAGIAFSVGAHCIGTGKFVGRSDAVPGYDAYWFQRGDEVVGVFDPGRKTGVVKLFGPAASTATLLAEALPGRTPIVTDIWGRSRPLKVANGRAVLALGPDMLFVNGCRKLAAAKAVVRPAKHPLAFEAESGRWSKGWGANPKAGFSGGRILELWKKEEPGPGGYWVALPMTVPKTGRYEVLFSGNSLSRLRAPPSLSPFVWWIDDGKKHTPSGSEPVLEAVPGAPEGLGVLGTVELTEGKHVFHLRLTGRRKQYDSNYALWFDAIALRRK